MKSMYYKKQTKKRVDKSQGIEVPTEVYNGSS